MFHLPLDPLLPLIIRVILPWIILFAFYIQMHGEESPGGGFQSGVILASGLALIAINYGQKKISSILSLKSLERMAALGCLIYFSVGIIPILKGGSYLQHSLLLCNSISSITCGPSGQKLGIFLAELGVGLTVFSAILGIFLKFSKKLEGI